MALQAPSLLALLEQAAAGIVLAFPDGHAALNPAARELLGLPSEAPTGTLPRPALAGEALGGASVAGALADWDGGGRRRTLLLSWAPLREGERIVAALGVIQDASGRDGADASSRPTLRMSDEFYAVIAHQLRTPLTPILGWARMLLQQRPDDPVLRRAADVIERNVRLEVRLVDDMLDVTRIQRGTLDLTMRRLDLRDLCRSAVEEQRRCLEGRTLALDLNLPDRPLGVDGDTARLTQIVNTLIANAVRFTPDGGRITVAAGRDGGHVVCSIVDTGEGIDPPLLGHLFDFSPQARHGAARASGGLGVSLAIARYIAERHGGSLSAQSDGLGCGARFVLSLPAAPTS